MTEIREYIEDGVYRYSIVPEFMNAEIRRKLEEYYNVFVDTKATNFAFKICSDYQILYGFHDDGIIEFQYENAMDNVLNDYLPETAMAAYNRAKRFLYQHVIIGGKNE